MKKIISRLKDKWNFICHREHSWRCLLKPHICTFFVKNKQTFKKIGIVIVVIFIILIVRELMPRKHLVLWAWEHNEDLTFLPKDVDVAYYAGSMILEKGSMKITDRLNPLKVYSDTKLLPVIRIDNFDGSKALYKERIDEMVDYIVLQCSESGVTGCQVDFDAKESERKQYISMLSLVRAKLPVEIPLSITALASWCGSDSWLSDAPISFAVPMLYRLGSDEYRIRTGNAGGGFLSEPKCGTAIGVITDEPLPNEKYFGNKIVYVFNPKAWTEESYKKTVNGINER